MRVKRFASESSAMVETWDPTLNDQVEFSRVPLFGKSKYWWICPLRHTWLASASNRASGKGCPICAGRTVLAGFNDLHHNFPEVAKLWNHQRNSPVSPKDVFAKTPKKFWWQCALGHEWQQSVQKVVDSKEPCPYCGNRKLLKGFNDLETSHPELAREWHPTLNQGRVASEVRPSETDKVWWQCSHGHHFQQAVYKRAQSGQSCRFCMGREVWPGFNDMKTKRPEMLIWWHPIKNGALTPSEVLPSGSTLIWWQCEIGHEWQETANQRSSRGDCPVCTNRLLQVGINDLATRYPQIAKYWDYERNEGLTPKDIIFGRAKKYWWKCEFGHPWHSTVGKRLKAQQCGICANRKVLIGYNDLASSDPSLAGEWALDLNGGLKPNDVAAGTHAKYWWRCQCGKTWQASVKDRVSGRGCRECAETGYREKYPGVLYFLGHNDLGSRKLGITNTPQASYDRLREFRRSGWETIAVWDFQDGSVPPILEKKLLTWLREDLEIPVHLESENTQRTGGYTETFEAGLPSDEVVIARVVSEIRGILEPGI